MKIIVNLPKMVLPVKLLDEEEEAILKLQTELSKRGYDVDDKSTLAFFVIGRKLRVQRAADTFVELIKVFDSPDIVAVKLQDLQKLMSMNWWQGVCTQKDGTLCVTTNFGNLVAGDIQPAVVVRCMLTHLLSNISFSNLKAGTTVLHDMRLFGYQSFAPVLMRRIGALVQCALPLRMTQIILVDPPWFLQQVIRLMKTVVSSKIISRIKPVAFGELQKTFPQLIIPKHLGGRDLFPWLSAEQLMSFSFLLNSQTENRSSDELKVKSSDESKVISSKDSKVPSGICE